MSGDRRRGGARGRLSVRVKSAKGRKLSSTRWLQRQFNDPYVAEAKRRGYRSRAALKLVEIDDKFRFLAPGKNVVDLGAAPGGWTQVAAARVNAAGERGRPQGRVVALDIGEMEPLAGVTALKKDFLERDAPQALKAALAGSADVVLNDMAPNTTGERQTDHLRILVLCEAAHEFAREVLAPKGVFVTKMLQGAGDAAFLASLRADFDSVKRVKPPASRSESSEVYIVATGFRGRS